MSHSFGSQMPQIKACAHVTPVPASILMWPLTMSVYLLSSSKDTNHTGFRVQPTLVWPHLNWLHLQRHLFLNKLTFMRQRLRAWTSLSENNSAHRNVLTGLIIYRNYILWVYLQGNRMSLQLPPNTSPNCLLHFTSRIFPRSNIIHKISPLLKHDTYQDIFESSLDVKGT